MYSKGLQYSEEKYNQIKARLIKNKKNFSEQIFGGRKSIYLNNQFTATTVTSAGLDMGTISKKKFTAFLGMFNRIMYNQFLKNPKLLELKINFNNIDIVQFNKIQGLPFGNNELIEKFKQLVK